MSTKNNLRIAFFGTPSMAVFVLEELERGGYLPELIICAPDKPVGRHQEITPPPTKVFAEEKYIDVFQPQKLDDEALVVVNERSWDLFIVAGYGKIIPEKVLAIPKYGTLNVHPSLLPAWRGASPIQSALLSGDKKTAVSIMLLDKELDHGPVLSQREVSLDSLMPAKILEEKLSRLGGQELVRIIPSWIKGEITPKEQDHARATFCTKIKKEDGELLSTDTDEKKWQKFCAFDEWPGVFFFVEKNGKRIRVKITEAVYENGAFVIKKVIPEGKKEMEYGTFLQN